MNVLKQHIGIVCKHLTLELILGAVINGWLLTSILTLITKKSSPATVDFAFQVHLSQFALCFATVVLVLLALSFLKVYGWFQSFGTLALLTVYGLFTINADSPVLYLVALGIFSAVSAWYGVSRISDQIITLSKRNTMFVYVICGLVYVGFTGTVTVCKYLAFRSGSFDLGIWAQMFYSMKHSLLQTTTCERNMVLSHFAVHFSPIYYLWLPFYALFSSPVTLQVLQVLTVGSGLIPLILLCRHFKLSQAATAVFALLYILHPAATGGAYFDMHENCFLVPFLLWFFLAIEKNSWKSLLFWTFMLFWVKEDVPVYTASAGLTLLIGQKSYKKGGFLLGVSIIAFVAMAAFIGSFGLGIQSYRYANFMADTSKGSLMDVIRTIIANPSYFINQCLTGDKAAFLFFMLAPLGLLPLFGKKISGLLLLIPMVLVNLASDVVTQSSIFYQYVFGPMAILLYLSIKNYASLHVNFRRLLICSSVAISIMLLPATALTRTYFVNMYAEHSEEYKELDHVFATIPKNASVMASPFYVAHLADRKEVYLYPDTGVQADYLVLDLSLSNIGQTDIMGFLKEGYVVVSQKEGRYILLKK